MKKLSTWTRTNKNADEICASVVSLKVAELNVTFACKKRTDERFSNAFLCFSQRQCFATLPGTIVRYIQSLTNGYFLAFENTTRANHIYVKSNLRVRLNENSDILSKSLHYRPKKV